jgi:hypothetical protein
MPDANRPAKPRGLLRTLWMLATAMYRFRKAMKQARKEAAAHPRTAEEELLDGLGCAAIALFSVAPAMRLAHPEVQELAKSLSDRVPSCGWLNSIFQVLEDEPVVVIEPSTGIGIIGSVSGVDINFTLNMLIMDQFPGADGKSQSRLSPKAASVLSAGGPQCVADGVVGTWNLYNWQALLEDSTLPSGQSATEHWIWNEGTPADIAVFEGRRAILLGPPAYARSWPAQRTFAAMRPGLRIEQVLTRDEVRDWLARMVAAKAVQN